MCENSEKYFYEIGSLNMTENQSVNVEMKPPNISAVDGSFRRTQHKPAVVEVSKAAPKKSSTSMRDQTVKKYRLLKTIGKGNFARVMLARHMPTDSEVAIKIIDK